MTDRSSNGLDINRPLNRIGRQAAEIIDADTDWAALGADLDVSHYRRDDPYPEWHAETTDFDPMFLATLWAKTEDGSIYGLTERLKNNPEIAEAFGFDTDEIPCGDTFNNTWNDRFEELQDDIETTAQMIGEIAHERGCAIGTVGLNPEETGGTSKRTEQRLLRKKTKEVLDEMSDVIFPALNLPRPDGAIYDEEDLLELLTVMGIKGKAAHGGADINSDRLASIRDIDLYDPFYKDGLTGETLLNAIHELSVKQITYMVNRAAGRIINRVKHHAKFPEPVFMAIDMTYVAYHGEREEMEWVTGAPDHKEYSWCHKFATATLVGDGIHLVVGMVPVGNPETVNRDAYPGNEEKSYICGDVVRKLLSITSDHITPRCVYADREFAAADVIAAFENHNLKYLMPAPRNDRSKRWLRRNVDMERGIVAVQHEWGLYGPVKHGSSNERVETTIIGVPGDLSDDQYGYGTTPDEDEETIPEEKQTAVPFYTNLNVSDELGIDRRQTMRQIKKYNRRGGIETSYKKIKEFASYTTSKAFEVRNFHFGFAVLLYNAWLMVDFLVQIGLDFEFRPKPRITAQRFLEYINRKLVGLI